VDEVVKESQVGRRNINLLVGCAVLVELVGSTLALTTLLMFPLFLLLLH